MRHILHAGCSCARRFVAEQRSCHAGEQELRKQTSKCPICRNHVESLLHIKMHKPGAGPKPAVDSTAAVADAVRDLKL